LLYLQAKLLQTVLGAQQREPRCGLTTLTASTRCAVEAASLPASQPPAESPTKKKQDDRHRDRSYIHNRLAAAFVEHLGTLRGIPLRYGCYAGTTKDVKSEGTELARSIHRLGTLPHTCHNASTALLRSRFHRNRTKRACSARHPSIHHLPHRLHPPASLHLIKLLPGFFSTAT